MPIIKQEWIYRKDLRAKPEWFYVFGDNEIRQGSGGQAKEMRGEPNAIGIRTKALPGTGKNAYWSDDNFAENVKLMTQDILVIKDKLENGHVVVFPTAGVGTGYAKLEEKAPKTFSTLMLSLELLERLFYKPSPEIS